ncbi:hypothetical protein U3A55_10425 [Salarchaeum sp. III]|uniref:DUF7692 domain-containing protein n=1 Tax=Salarchaeum sp. III TaxID=3107927 RepID=UPI002EDB6338
MRIRTDGDYAHRMDTIEAAAERLGVNKTRAVLLACDSVGQLLDGVEEALEHPDLPPSVQQDIADQLSTRYIEVSTSNPTASVSPGNDHV